MARTPTITPTKILAAARAVFLEVGFSATVVDIADRAGISSASIFKHFPTKEALFFAAMSVTATSQDRLWTGELAAAIGHGDPRADLLQIAQRIATYTSDLLPQMMLAWSLRQPGEIVKPPGLEPDLAEIVAYLEKEMALGRIMDGDPMVPAMTLLHTIVGFTMSQTLQDQTIPSDTNSFLENFVDLLWRSLDPNL
jgi:AcrR family transcriptional regulator